MRFCRRWLSGQFESFFPAKSRGIEWPIDTAAWALGRVTGNKMALCFFLPVNFPDCSAREFYAPSAESAVLTIQELARRTGLEYDLWIPFEWEESSEGAD